ncbi:hypothetical protein U8P75_24470 (plasmid) [Rhizobium beringeri]|nr:hypothetical protein U8P75_24470 [Rhizobium beringeri]
MDTTSERIQRLGKALWDRLTAQGAAHNYRHDRTLRSFSLGEVAEILSVSGSSLRQLSIDGLGPPRGTTLIPVWAAVDFNEKDYAILTFIEKAEASSPYETEALVETSGSLMKRVIAVNRGEKAIGPGADRFDVTRRHNPHLSFDQGPHFCLGATLARVELCSAFPALFVRWSIWRRQSPRRTSSKCRLKSLAAGSACRSPSALSSHRE